MRFNFSLFSFLLVFDWFFYFYRFSCFLCVFFFGLDCSSRRGRRSLLRRFCIMLFSIKPFPKNLVFLPEKHRRFVEVDCMSVDCFRTVLGEIWGELEGEFDGELLDGSLSELNGVAVFVWDYMHTHVYCVAYRRVWRAGQGPVMERVVLAVFDSRIFEGSGSMERTGAGRLWYTGKTISGEELAKMMS